ncbi:hypothetical protein GGI55_006665 [Rhizobium leguminosarum]|uniref:hypothetical protein n=1 Tax=Rhizobium TaxID=379 RepID=UPI00161829B1|nr:MULTISPECIES: hypothetical protein [Rhizobium]MBB4300722.1 hypothetical protein [Rhizobium leguminosarum]MBB4436252.1 hypothetical protein [Rhizobium esperanzae]MBB4545930.1 hypothetical protein [Rhizobium leguminosarum]MBB5655545.1 hypothetical protein [Rhizobium leguminosarum]MBB6269305.1 hypothetical protein [Rhizobium leguminosarum]
MDLAAAAGYRLRDRRVWHLETRRRRLDDAAGKTVAGCRDKSLCRKVEYYWYKISGSG